MDESTLLLLLASDKFDFPNLFGKYKGKLGCSIIEFSA